MLLGVRDARAEKRLEERLRGWHSDWNGGFGVVNEYFPSFLLSPIVPIVPNDIYEDFEDLVLTKVKLHFNFSHTKIKTDNNFGKAHIGFTTQIL